jgi:hypothetical protein
MENDSNNKPAPRVVEAEIVREPRSHGEVESVTVRRIPGGAFFTRGLFASEGDAEKARKRLKELRLKLWLYALGLMLIAAGCFIGAFLTDVVIFAAFLIVAGLAVSLAAGVVYLLLRAVRAISLPEA